MKYQFMSGKNVMWKEILAVPPVLLVPGNMEIRTVGGGYACVDIKIFIQTWSIFCSRFPEIILRTFCNALSIFKVVRGLDELSKYFKGK